MFGGSLFGGEDINQDALGGGGGGDGNDFGQNDEGDSGESRDVDPAVNAAQEAYQNAGNIANKDSGQQIAAGINHGTGLFTSIAQMFGPREVGLAKRQRIQARAEAKYRIDQSQRALDQYKEDSAIQEQKLSQSYFGRGIGESSIYNEGMQYYRDTVARQMDDLAQRRALAQTNWNLVHSQIKQSYAQKWLGFGNALGNMV